MTAWLSYAAVSAALLIVGAALVSAVVSRADPLSVWVAAGIAYPVQLLAFAGLVASRRRQRDFVVSWGSGMLLRFAVVAGVALWVTRASALDAPSALLSLVSFVFLLVLIEPLFLRRAD